MYYPQIPSQWWPFLEKGITQTISIGGTYSKPEKVVLSVLGNGPGKVSKAFHEYAGNQTFEIREWPSMSLDLNIMENNWKLISDIVYSGEQPQNKSALSEKILYYPFTLKFTLILDKMQGN